ncbi:MAG: M48 family metallopeptidase [Sphingomonas sp.]
MLILVALIATSLTSVDDAGLRDLLRLQRLDQRVETIGYRLAHSAGALCAEQVPLTGIAVHDLSAYGGTSRADARRAFGLGSEPTILAVARGSPAERSGLRIGDALVAFDGESIPAAPGGLGTYQRVAAVEDSLDHHAADGRLDLDIRRGGTPYRLHIALELGCASRFLVRPSDAIDAGADGHYVEITSAYVELAESDDGLALVLAHELAHNILHHRDRLNAARVHRGLLQDFGRSASLTRATEIEADRLSLYLVDRAGFSIDEAIRFREDLWRGSREVLRSATHPSGAERLAILRAEMARIKAFKATGALPEPGAE